MQLRSRRLRTAFAAAAVVAPSVVRRFLYTRLLGYEIDRTARIGRSLIDVERFRAGPGAVVSSAVAVRGLDRLELGEGASIGPLVWVNGVRSGSPALSPDLVREPALVLGRNAALTSLHFVDCSDRLELGDEAVIAGAMSQILTHSFDYRAAAHYCAPVELGDYAVVGTKSLLMPGTVIGARTIVAGGSVVNGGSFAELKLVAGVPAKEKADLDPNLKLFQRSGHIV